MRIYEQKQYQIQKKRWILFQLSFDTQLVTQSSWALTMQNRCIGSFVSASDSQRMFNSSFAK